MERDKYYLSIFINEDIKVEIIHFRNIYVPSTIVDLCAKHHSRHHSSDQSLVTMPALMELTF